MEKKLAERKTHLVYPYTQWRLVVDKPIETPYQ